MKEKTVVLKSGKKVKIKIPPLSFDGILRLQRELVKKAMVDPELLALLSPKEVQEAFVFVSKLNHEFWSKEIQKWKRLKLL